MTFILSNKLRFTELETYNIQCNAVSLSFEIECKSIDLLNGYLKLLLEYLDKMGSRKSKNSSCELVVDSWSSNLDVDKVGVKKERSSKSRPCLCRANT